MTSIESIVNRYYQSCMTQEDYDNCFKRYMDDGGDPDAFPSKGELDASVDTDDSVHEFRDYDSIEENKKMLNKRFYESLNSKDFEEKYINSLSSQELKTALLTAIEDYRCRDINDENAYDESLEKFIRLGGNSSMFPNKDELNDYILYIDMDTNYSEEAYEKEHQVESKKVSGTRMKEDYIPSEEKSFAEKYGDGTLLEDDEEDDMIDPLIKEMFERTLKSSKMHF